MKQRFLITIETIKVQQLIKMLAAIVFLINTVGMSPSLQAQDKLYSNSFPLAEVRLMKGPFLHARDLNIATLLAYDVDRLLNPFLKEAGLPTQASSYPNWS